MITVNEPTNTVRQLGTPPAEVLAALASLFAELQVVLRCCEHLVDRLATNGSGPADALELEALWTTAVLSYARCFAAEAGEVALTESDVSAIELQGEVLEWHKMLQRMRELYVSLDRNPREQFFAAAVQSADGTVGAVAVTSTVAAAVDDRTVRQTGGLALALSKLVDLRISEQQERVLADASAMSKADLDLLPLIDLSVDESAPEESARPDPPEAGSSSNNDV